MTTSDELRLLREQIAQLEATVAGLYRDESIGGTARVGKLVSGGSFPTAPTRLKVFKVQFESVTGTESENATGTIAVDSGYGYAVQLGTNTPTAGTEVLLHHDGKSWVFRY